MNTKSHSNLNNASDMLKAMSNSERLSILLLLLEHESSLQELVQATGLTATQVGNHLYKMRQLGMVDYTRFMRIMQYRITSDETKNVLRALSINPKEIT
ncbi:ArsR family transcriptional regulator [Kingella kingae PYKK081]|nr:ArsR family transcriptional regulator [Kingella kingae PYKK081]